MLSANSPRGPTMGEPIGQRSMRLNQDKRCRRVSSGDVCARVSQGNLTLSPPTYRKPAMGEPIGRCSTRHLRVNGRCRPDQPEQHSVRGNWCWMPALTESRPWGNPSIDARCGRTRRTGVGEFLEQYPSVTTWLRLEQHPVRGTWLSVWLHQVSWSGSEIPSYGGTHQERHLHAVRLERRSGVSRIVAPAELPRLGVPTLLIYRSRTVGVSARAAWRSVGVLT